MLSLDKTQSSITFNPKYKSGQLFRIELVAKTDGGDKPSDDDKNTTAIILACVAVIIVAILLAVVCIKRNSASKTTPGDVKNSLVQNGSRAESMENSLK